jgi:hypothetical protein
VNHWTLGFGYKKRWSAQTRPPAPFAKTAYSYGGNWPLCFFTDHDVARAPRDPRERDREEIEILKQGLGRTRLRRLPTGEIRSDPDKKTDFCPTVAMFNPLSKAGQNTRAFESVRAQVVLVTERPGSGRLSTRTLLTASSSDCLAVAKRLQVA